MYLYVGAFLLLTACPPQPRPTPLPDAAPMAADACDFSLDAGVPVHCAGLFVRKGLPREGAPCVSCPLPMGCYYERAGAWCVPLCRQDATCEVAWPDVAH